MDRVEQKTQYGSISTSTTEGRVINIEPVEEFVSILFIHAKQDEDHAFFPRLFNDSETANLLDQEVRYQRKVEEWHIDRVDYGLSKEFRLEVVSGPLQGSEFKEELLK